MSTSINDTPIPQASAIPVRAGQICLITAARDDRWIVPKGMVDPGYTLEEAALQEAWEEAGLQGSLRSGPIGEYTYQKWGQSFRVTVFLMDVETVAETWPEAHRQRRWVPPAEAVELLANDHLRSILQRAIDDGLIGAVTS